VRATARVRAGSVARLQQAPYIALYLAISPRAPYISLYLPISPHISPYLPISWRACSRLEGSVATPGLAEGYGWGEGSGEGSGQGWGSP